MNNHDYLKYPMKPMNSDYLIELSDRRFELVFQQWLFGVMSRLETATEIFPNPTFLDTAEINLVTTVHDIPTQIPKHIYKALKITQENAINDVLLAFPATQVPLGELVTFLELFLKKRRRFDYEITVFNAHSFSLTLDNFLGSYYKEQLLDYQMPNLNFLLIQYSGPKLYLHP